MNDHLPECRFYPHFTFVGDVGCICRELSACEQRVLRSAVNLALERQMDLLECNKDDNCHTYAYMAGVIADDIEYVLMRGRDERID